MTFAAGMDASTTLECSWPESCATSPRTVGEGVNGQYSAWTRTITLPTRSPPDDVALHELVHVFNHQHTGIGDRILGNSIAANKGMAYYLRVIYEAATSLQYMEGQLASGAQKCDRFSGSWGRRWAEFWNTYGNVKNYPFQRVAYHYVSDITFIDEVNVKPLPWNWIEV